MMPELTANHSMRTLLEQLRREIVRIELGRPKVFGLHVGAAVVLRRARETVRPAGDLPIRIERRDQVVLAERSEEVVAHVLFARPQQLDRLADLLRQHHGFGDEVVRQPPAESAADARHAHLDLQAIDAGELRGDSRSAARHLQWRDDEDAVLAHVDASVLRLEWSM